MGTQGEQCYPFKKKFRRISKMTILINAINIVMAIVVPLLEVAQLHKVKHEKRKLRFKSNQIAGRLPFFRARIDFWGK